MPAWLNALRNERGAFDLPSILVGGVVIGILTAGVLGSIFGVIPWAQDTSAKSSLNSVNMAESAAKVVHETYLSDEELAEKSLLNADPKIVIGTNAERTCYVGLSTSETGKTFYVTDRSTNAQVYNDGTDVGCLSAEAVSDLVNPPPLPVYSGQTAVGWASNSLASMSQDEADFGKQNGMLSTYADFASGAAFPTDHATAAAARKSALLIAWEPYDWNNPSLDQTDLRPANIAAGNKDAHITNWLKQAQGYAKSGTIMVRFAPEMNDAIRPWSVGVNGGNTAADYIAMWKHVYAIKQAVAPDVIMVWNPLVAGSDGAGNPVSISSVYPGTDFVDMLALDGFNWADTQDPGSTTCNWQSYDDVFKNPIAEIKTLAGGKPWGIAEVASASKPDSYFQPGGTCNSAWGWVYEWPESGEFYKTPSDWITQAGWMKVMMQKAHADGASFVNMFNTTKETDWRLNSTEEGKLVPGTVAADPLIIFGQQDSGAYMKAALK